MLTLRRTFLLTTIAALPSLASAGGHDWMADYDEAVQIAQKEGKDLLVDFTGSDWCIWCKRLHDQVFAYDSFLEAAKKDYVLVSLDFPKSAEAKAKVPNPERNQELYDKYKIAGYPTVLLMEPDGVVFGTTGYQAGGPEKYVEHLAELRATGKRGLAKINEVVEAWEEATGDARVAALEEVLAAMSKMKPDAPGLSRLVEPVKSAFELDPKNEKGLKLAAIRALVAAERMDADVMAAGREVDPKNEAGLLETIILAECQAITKQSQVEPACKAIAELDAMGPIKDSAVAFKLYVVAADWNDRFVGDPEAAKAYARKAKAIGGDKQLLARMDVILDS